MTCLGRDTGVKQVMQKKRGPAQEVRATLFSR
jgi:hypothetical protein